MRIGFQFLNYKDKVGESRDGKRGSMNEIEDSFFILSGNVKNKIEKGVEREKREGKWGGVFIG